MNEDFEEWAQKKVNEAKKRTESKQVAEQVLTDKEALKSQYAPKLWEEVQTVIETQAKVLNAKQSPDIPVLSVTRKLDRIIHVQIDRGELAVAKFNPQTYELGLSTPRNNHTFKPDVRNGEVWFCMGDTRGGQVTPTYIAQTLLGEIL